MMSDSFLSDAGSLFFAIWSLIIGAVTLKAFGRDLISSRFDPIHPPRLWTKPVRFLRELTSRPKATPTGWTKGD